MLPIYHADDGRGHLTLFHHGYITTGKVGNFHGFQLDYETAVGLIVAIQDWMKDDGITEDDTWTAKKEIYSLPRSESPATDESGGAAQSS